MNKAPSEVDTLELNVKSEEGIGGTDSETLEGMKKKI